MLIALGLAALFGWAAVVAGALAGVADALERRRWRRVAAEVALTDAVHRRFGAIAAPVVTRGPGRAWTVTLALGPRALGLAGPLAALARSVLGWDGRAVRVVVVPGALEERPPPSLRMRVVS